MSRVRQNHGGLKLSFDRKVSTRGTWQESRQRWIATVPNSFGLPSGASCPGKTPFCEACYGTRSETRPDTLALLQHNLKLLQEAGRGREPVWGMGLLLDEMIDWYVDNCRRSSPPVEERLFRIHWDGDFFSTEYAEAWRMVMMTHPEIQFWAYTRSFHEPVNVVPILHDVPNLSLYLSVDAWNVDKAMHTKKLWPEVRLALCSIDYQQAQRLSDEPAVPCPENARRIPLMDENGGACVSCGICPTGRRDIMFATTHRQYVGVPRPSEREAVLLGDCEGPGCTNPVYWQPGTRGRQPKYCSTECRWRQHTENQKHRRRAVQDADRRKSLVGTTS